MFISSPGAWVWSWPHVRGSRQRLGTGSGKTTVLRELLSQNKYKIGCVVNDVAAVNIDAKLVRNQTAKQGASASRTTSDLAPTIELQNGCACTIL